MVPVERTTALAVGATAVAVGAVALAYYLSDPPQPAPTVRASQALSGRPVVPPANAPAPTPSGPVRHGLVLHRDSLEVVDWSAWMAYAPDRFVEAIAQGFGEPEEILARVLQQIFPALRWPPAADSPYRPTWDRLVARVDQALPRVTADGTPGLRLV